VLLYFLVPPVGALAFSLTGTGFGLGWVFEGFGCLLLSYGL